MQRLITIYVALCGLAFANAAKTQEAPSPVPVEQGAYHVPTFRNEYVTVLNVNIPGKRTTDYHIHSHDQVCVVVEDYPPEAYSQPLGGPPGQPRGAALGEVSFIAYYSKHYTHRAINPGTLPRHSICAELTGPKPFGFTAAARDVPGYTQVLDNERVRAWRLVLAPGQAAPAITQHAPGLRIIVKGGEIAEVLPDKRERGMMLRPGEFYWQNAGVTRAVRNIGTTPVEMVEFELK
jgi:mannose-6-phosphate isomerase-like protein (cupin superfamily)